MSTLLWISARAICGNCRLVLIGGLHEGEYSNRWVHEQTGRDTCPGAPMARPVEDTIQHLAHEPD